MSHRTKATEPKIWIMILISLVVIALTWTWFEKKIQAIDEKIEILHK